jgi:hypothetical protein
VAMNIKNKYEIGQPVFLVTDPEQVPGMVISIKVSQLGLTYEVRFDCEVLDLYEMEITDRVDELKKLGVVEKKEK